ncbi:MAG: hypothetical protein ACJ8AT_16805 [Hyalangium sp.]|uniref:hypothetical protein n=1 Tax=Hyalangium sp. TaxID=2028555 RepID=UPI003899E831
MAKIGSPLSPGVGRNPAPGPAGTPEPAAAPQPAHDGAPPHSPPPEAPPASNQAQQVAQQFGSAFASAGRLATQLVKGLVPGANTAQPQRTEKEKGPVEREEEGKSAPQLQDAAPQPGEAGTKNPFVAAFNALKRSRLFRFNKLRRSRAGRSEAVNLIYGDDYDEDEQDRHRARAWLGHDQEDTTFEHAKREALLLHVLERQGEPPLRIVRQLNFQLGVRPDREFKHLLCDEVRPLMDALAGRVEQLSPEERRALAAMVSRAAYQVGVRSADNFSQLLSTAGAVEAAQLEASSAPLVERAAHLERALRQAASPAYRAALIQAGCGFLEKLAGGMAGLAPQERQLVWGSLLRSAESVEPGSLSLMAHAVVAGILGDKGTGNAGLIAEALGPALRTVPGGGSWAVQLVFVLSARGEAQAAEQLAEVLRGVIHEARGACIPAFQGLHAVRNQPSGGAGSEEDLLRELEDRAPLLVALMPACAQALDKANTMPPAASALGDEALLALGSLDQVGATAAGQRMLRRTLLAQERGSQTFLTALPKVASTLAQPQWVSSLDARGLVPANYKAGGQPFLQRVATQTGQALTGPVLARSQKGDSPSARVLLRSAIRNNTALFGLKPEGARLAADVLEALRDKPGMDSLQRSLVLLEKIRGQHAVSKHFTSVETLQVVATALAERGMSPSQQGAGPGRREPPRLTALEIAIDQSAHARQKASAPAPAPEPKPKPPAAPRSRK